MFNPPEKIALHTGRHNILEVVHILESSPLCQIHQRGVRKTITSIVTMTKASSTVEGWLYPH